MLILVPVMQQMEGISCYLQLRNVIVDFRDGHRTVIVGRQVP